MDFIYDILDNPKFNVMFLPKLKEDIESRDLKENPLPSSSSLVNRKSSIFDNNSKKEEKTQKFSIFVVFDSFMICVKKVLQLLFLEKKDEAQKLYDSLFERLGEAVLPLVNSSYMELVRGYRKDSLRYHQAKKGSQQSLYENVYFL